MKYRFFIFVLTLVSLIKMNAQESGTAGLLTAPPDFAHISYDAASDAVRSDENNIMGSQVKRIGTEYITNLVGQIRSGNLNNEKKVLAIYLLGALHPVDTNSIEVLLDNIDLRATRFDPGVRPMRWGEYPAEEALIRIGKPAIEPILNHLPIENSELRRQLMCNVIKQVLRRK